MQLTPEQEAKVRAWAADGASLSDIQTRLADECGVRLSYLETRFLLLDLKVDLVEKPKKSPPPPDLPASGGAGVPPADDYGAAPPLPGEPGGPGAEPPPYADDPYGEPEGAGAPPADDPYGEPEGAGVPPADAPASSVQVDLARIQRPGFAASGSITCSDGVKGEWGIDNYGRLALAFPDNKGYRPSAADQQAFMQKLRELLSGGY